LDASGQCLAMFSRAGSAKLNNDKHGRVDMVLVLLVIDRTANDDDTNRKDRQKDANYGQFFLHENVMEQGSEIFRSLHVMMPWLVFNHSLYKFDIPALFDREQRRRRLAPSAWR
jgi:hypothetical protein